MSQQINAYPLTWPYGWKRTQVLESARFSRRANAAPGSSYRPLRDITISEAVAFVLGELKRMGINDWQVIISSNLRLRGDGLPASGQAEPADRGVAVWWRDGERQQVMAIDKYNRAADNLYAIGKTLEALRSIERWGSGEILQRTYTGFQALPPSGESSARRSWWEVLDVKAHSPTADVEEAYKRARSKAHPDRTTGSHAAFLQVQQAWDEFCKERGHG